MNAYPTYSYSDEDVRLQLARFVELDNANNYPFDSHHAHEYNEMMVFAKGGGNHNINFKNYKVKDHSIHFLAAKDLHWLDRSMDSSGFVIVFKDQFLHKLQTVHTDIDFQHAFQYSKVINLNTKDADDFKFLIQEIWHNNEQSAYQLQLIGALLTKVASLSFSNDATPRMFDEIVPKLIALIQKHYQSQKAITAYAEMLNMSSRTLQQRVKAATGITIGKMIQEHTLKEAKRMLCTSSKNINEIADELGFKEAAHFSNWFKKLTDLLPTEYKYGS